MNFGKGTSKKNVRKKIIAAADDEDHGSNNTLDAHTKGKGNVPASSNPEHDDAQRRLEELAIANETVKRVSGPKKPFKSSVLSFNQDEQEVGSWAGNI